MNALQSIQSTLERTARRRRLARALHGMWRGLLVGAALWVVTLAVYKVVPLPPAALGWAAVAAWACPIAGAVLGGRRRPSLAETACWLDLRLNLKERLSTALEVARADADGWRELVVQDAARHAHGLDVRRLVPFHLPPAARWCVLVLALGAGLGFVPEYRSPKYRQKQADAVAIQHVGQQLAELTRRDVQRRPPVLPATQKSLEAVTDLGEKFQKASLTRSDALRDLANVSERLKEQLKDLRNDPALRKLEEAARAPGGDAPSGVNLQPQIERLQRELGAAGTNSSALADLQQKLEQLQQAAQGLANQTGEAADARANALSTQLAALASQAAQLGLQLPQLDAAIAALAARNTDRFLQELDQALTDLEKLRDLARRLEALQAQAEKLGKDLAEQLQLGQAQAAANTLRKMVEQLRSSNLSPEQMQRILDEVAKAAPQAADYGKVADLLQRALKQGQQGDRSGTAQSLAAAANELEKLLQQMGDAQALLAALEKLDSASMCIAQGRCWGLSACQRPGFNPLRGPPGAGVGTWGEEGGEWMPSGNWTPRYDHSDLQRPDLDPRGVTERESRDLSDVLKPDKVRGRFSPGDSMPSVPLRGLSIKGASRVQYQEAVAAAQAEAQSALSQEKVPRAYQAPVRDYFDDLKQ